MIILFIIYMIQIFSTFIFMFKIKTLLPSSILFGKRASKDCCDSLLHVCCILTGLFVEYSFLRLLVTPEIRLIK
jgi:hypothetical protein